MGKKDATNGEIDVIAIMNSVMRGGRNCKYQGGGSMVLSEFDITVTLHWRVNGNVYKKKRFKPTKRARCPTSVMVGKKSGAFMGSKGGLPSSSASVASAIKWIDKQLK